MFGTGSTKWRNRAMAGITAATMLTAVHSAAAQEGMLFTGVNIGGTMTQSVMIYQSGAWSTLFTRPFCVDAACVSLIQNLAVDENARRVYWMNGVDLEYWDVDTGTFHKAQADVLAPGLLIRALAFNPDDGLLYAIKRAPTVLDDEDILSIDPATGQMQLLFSIDPDLYRFNTLDYNRNDNTFYAYHTGAGFDDEPEGLYRINILGDQAITAATNDPWGGFVAVGAAVRGDEAFVVRSPGSPFPSQKGTISSGGPPWSDFVTPPSPSGTERGTAMAWWLFPEEPDCAADIADSNGSTPDGMVDVFDLLTLLDNWNTSGPGAEIAEPTNLVDVFDLLGLLGVWGDCD